MTQAEVDSLMLMLGRKDSVGTPCYPRSASHIVCVLFQVMANVLDNKLREDLERLKKIRAHRGLRHYWG